MKRPAALVLIASHKHTGPGRVALQHARLLREAGWETLFCCQPGGDLQTAAEGAELWCDAGLALPTRGQVWSMALDLWRLRRLVRARGVGLCFCYRTQDHLTAALAFGGCLPTVRFVPNAVVYDDASRPLGRAGTWLATRFASCVLVPDALAQHALLSARGPAADRLPAAPGGAGWEASQALRAAGDAAGVSFAPGGVDTLHFAPDRGGVSVRQELGLTDAHVVVGLVSRLKPGRGHDRFLRAFAQAAAEETHLRALIVGHGDKQERERITAAAARWAITDRVAVFAPGVRYEQALAAIDIGCLFHPGSAGTGQAALELMSMARPVVVPATGVLALLEPGAEVIRASEGASAAEGEPGGLDPAPAFAAALVRLARNPNLRLARGQAARALAENRFSRTVLQKQLAALAERLAPALGARTEGQ